MIMVFDLIIDLLTVLIFGIFFIWIFLFILKLYCKQKGKSKAINQIEDIESKLKNVGKKIWNYFLMILTMVICATLAIAVKPIIYKLNFPLGEGYATFASYMIAICLYVILKPKIEPIQSKGRKKQNGI